MKTRFSTADISVMVKELKRFLGMRVSNVYDIDNKTYLIRLQRPDQKAVILLESGIRLHSTDFDWPKNPAPSGFSMKMRKHLKGRRLETIRQLGVDRIVDLQFGSAEAAYHVVLELYDRGNIVLTDYEYTILNILRPRTDNSQDVRFAVREIYPLDVAKQHEVPTEEKLRQIILSGREGDPLKKMLIPNLDYGPALLDHCLRGVGFTENVRLGKDFSIPEDMSKLLLAIEEAEKLLEKLQSENTRGFIIQKKDKRPITKGDEEQEIITYEEFHPLLLRQHENKLYAEFDSFDSAVDEFFSKVESQRLDIKTLQQEKAALKKLENVRKDHEKRINELQKEQESDILRGQLIEMNLPLVDEALLRVRSALANQIDWTEIWKLIKEAQLIHDPVACAIKSVRLDTNHITLLLSDPYEDGHNEDDEDYLPLKPMKIDVDLSLSAYANSRKYFDKKKQAAKKEQKTVDASTKAFKSAEKKTKQTLKDVATIASINKTRKTFWFEKFLWFISSENFLVIGGRDQQQNELIVKRYLRPGDLYVHADLHGASSCIIKNPSGEPVPPKTLNEAGTMAICNSAAWDAKVVTSAWYVYHDQVSKTAPSGEYLSTGSFMVRGKKNYLPPSYLIYGFAYLFKLEEGSIPRHQGERKVRTIEEDESSFTNSISVESDIADSADVTDDKNDANSDSESEEETEGKCDTDDDGNNSDTADSTSETNSSPVVSCRSQEISKTGEESCGVVSTGFTSECALSKSNSVVDSGSVKEKTSSKSSPVGTVTVKTDDSEAVSPKKNSDSEADSDSEKNTIAFPDTSINLLHVKGDKFELQRTISTSSTASGISEGESRVIFLGDNQPVTIGDRCVNTGAKLSAKQRRELRKARKEPASRLQADDEEDKVSWLKQESSTTTKDGNKEKQTTESAKSETPTQQPPKRGQKGKLKKIKDKYKDQDEEERQLRMEILASAGVEKEAKNKKGKKGKNLQKFGPGNNKQPGMKGDDKDKQVSEKAEGNKSKQTGPVELSSIIQQTVEISVEDEEKINVTSNDTKKTAKPEAVDSDDEKTEGNAPQTDDTQMLDSLTGCPFVDDELLYAIPMCAPYSCLINFKYKVKLLPGNTKRGKAAKTAINMFLHEKSATSREKDLLRIMKDVDVSRNIPGKVKLAAPNLRKAKK
ncbi:nuclear export mediator factor Nemf-like [Gigantopelta aegis]|uniref:nuclear export mediator factor Nemf-like n=1 Tax=Gigantopelta aegis TaxID=1735272 RepID=UPI001B887831|nr:nuclear export mediator factor Nemf-like [Gigantopelta aegis]